MKRIPQPFREIAAAAAGVMLWLFASIAAFGQAAEDFRPVRVCRVAPGAGVTGIVLASDNDQQNIFLLRPRSLSSFSLIPFRNSWTTEPGGELLFAVGSGTDSIALVTAADENFTARIVSADLGLVKGSHEFPRAEYFAVHPANGRLLLGRTGGTLALSDPSGRIYWESADGPRKIEAVAAGARFIAVTGESEHRILRMSDGGLAARLGKSGFGGFLGFSGDLAILRGEGNELAVVDPRDSKVHWRFRTGGSVNGFAVAGDSILVASSDNYIYRLGIDDGDVIWKARTGDRVLSAPVVHGTLVFAVNSLKNSVGIYDFASGRPLDLAKVPDDDAIIGVIPFSGGGFVVVTAARIYEYSRDCKQKGTAGSMISAVRP